MILELLTILSLKLGFVSEVWWDKGTYMLIVVLSCPLPRLPTSCLVETGSWPPAPSPDASILAVLCLGWSLAWTWEGLCCTRL